MKYLPLADDDCCVETGLDVVMLLFGSVILGDTKSAELFIWMSKRDFTKSALNYTSSSRANVKSLDISLMPTTR